MSANGAEKEMDRYIDIIINNPRIFMIAIENMKVIGRISADETVTICPKINFVELPFNVGRVNQIIRARNRYHGNIDENVLRTVFKNRHCEHPLLKML